MKIINSIEIESLTSYLTRFWDLATIKVKMVEREYDNSKGSPVFTIDGKYTTKSWTEWTQGFQYGIPLLIFEATGDTDMLQIGRVNILNKMTHHLTNFGVHDHGFNNISTFGNLLRLGNSKKFECTEAELNSYRLALKISGAVQAKRWTKINNNMGYIYSFNGPHSLFIDTIRTCRILIASHILGHRMLDENEVEINLLQRAINHALTTANYAIFYGSGRDRYDEKGRVAQESVFNVIDGNYRSSNSQQGYSGYTTWSRGLSWAMLGFTEILEFLCDKQSEIQSFESLKETFLEVAIATCNYYLNNTSLDGIPFWDMRAPNSHKIENYTELIANPFNDYEPIDSSAAAIAVQALIRLSNLLKDKSSENSKKYMQAGLLILKTLLSDTYLSLDDKHQGILCHSIYNYPNMWDHVSEGNNIPNGESSMWGDYHITEACLLVHSIIQGDYYTFFKGLK